MDNNENKINTGNEIKSQSVEMTISAASSLVGFAIGGPIGAIIGGATTPAVKLSYQIVQQWIERRKHRISTALDKAFSQTKISDEDVLLSLSNDSALADDIMRLLRQLVDTDPELDSLFARIIASMIIQPDIEERKRLSLLGSAIKGINSVQMHIIKAVATNDNVLSAKELSIAVGIPEIELRNSVRDLELRGIITDNNSEPTVWELRELGKAIANIYFDMEETIHEQ